MLNGLRDEDHFRSISISSPGLFPQKMGGPHPFFEGKALGTRLDQFCSDYIFTHTLQNAPVRVQTKHQGAITMTIIVW